MYYVPIGDAVSALFPTRLIFARPAQYGRIFQIQVPSGFVQIINSRRRHSPHQVIGQSPVCVQVCNSAGRSRK